MHLFGRQWVRYRRRISTTKTSCESPEKPGGLGLDMKMPEGEWGIFKDCWAKYRGITAMMVTEGMRD